MRSFSTAHPLGFSAKRSRVKQRTDHFLKVLYLLHRKAGAYGEPSNIVRFLEREREREKVSRETKLKNMGEERMEDTIVR